MTTIARIAACLALLVFIAPGAGAQAPQIESIKILDYGIYRATRERVEPETGTATGTISISSDYRLVEQTETIPASLGLQFGIRYVINGHPKGEPVRLTWVLRYPPGGIVNPKGETFTKNEFVREAYIGEEKFRTFSFDEPWELAAGDWYMEFYYEGRLLASKRFRVIVSS